MSDTIEKSNYIVEVDEFGKYSWIKPALVMCAIATSTYGIIVIAPHLLEIIQGIFQFLIFFGMLS